MTPMIYPNSYVAQLSPYQLADLTVPDGVQPIMLAQNESFRPPSPHAEKAVAALLERGHLYPRPVNATLDASIRDTYGLVGNQIMLGAGSMELIDLTMRAFLSPASKASEVVCGEYTYGYFAVAIKAAGGKVIHVSEPDYTPCVDHLLAGVNAHTKIVVIANPGNPTGTCISNQEIRRLRQALPARVLLLVDEAYGEFTDANQEDPSIFDLVDLGNTMVLRTFSKAYGLAAIRLGWGFMPAAIAQELYKIKNPNSTSSVSQLAALAALQDQAYMKQTVAQTRITRETFCNFLAHLPYFQDPHGATIPVSHTNFVLLPFASAEQASSLNKTLREQGILVRPMSGKLAHTLRITMGSKDDMQQCGESLALALEKH